MQGFNTLFQPGFDHAGISTQNVVERALVEEGTSRQELGREAFERARLGMAARVRRQDPRRLPPHRRVARLPPLAVDDGRRLHPRGDAFFVHLYRRGWIYRANRIINWCPYHETSLSDLELEHEDVDDTLSTIRYPLADGDGFIPIATVRPATIPADVAVAVHPDDERYKHLIGREVIVPWTENRVPVIADERVEREFGTGALKITPAHDPTDFEIGRDHGLPEPSCIGPDGRVDRRGARRADPGGGRREDPRLVPRARPAREARALPPQRRVLRALPLAHRAAASRCSGGARWKRSSSGRSRRSASGEIRYHPESQHRFAIDSLENAPDWCISRQIWWGHQIPAWYCPDGHVTVELDEPAACAECGSTELTRETDVLDTWFSSALWPFATLGWPDQTPELAQFYPGNVNTTARDIIRLWENRMIFSGLELLGERPFDDVVIHSDRARDRRAAHVEVARERHRRVRGARPLRRRRDALRAAEELADAGRALLVRGDRGGREALEQALERRAPDRAPRAKAPRRRSGRHRSRSGGSSRGCRRRSGGSRATSARSTSRTRWTSCTTSRSTTSATGTSRR